MKLLPQPTVPGKVSGIIALDPLTLQCGECGEVTTNGGPYGDWVFLLLARWIFCPRERVAWNDYGPRRCRDCQAEHAQTCGRCARA